jgi:acyl transferase domain-containing protein
MTVDLPPGAIAVIGLGCRFPGADSAEAFWQLLSAGKEAITRFTDAELEAAGVDQAAIGQPGYVPAKGVLDQADAFDAAFFGFSPYEAALMDPQQRVFIECAWMALEDAGYDPKNFRGPIGIFAGSILSTYLLRNLWPNRRLVEEAGVFQIAVGNDPTFLATRASYLLDLKGPSISVGTACSTSLVAVHLACQSLLSHECDMALAGGVSVHVPLIAGYRYEKGGILSPDGHCRPFDAEARGTVSGDGAGVVVLKRLEDAIAVGDGVTIHAVIRGSAVNNDGSDKVGFTAPSGGAQARVIAEALAMADVEPGTVAMLEAHAAGTLLGDPIEVAALAEVFGAFPRRSPCAIGSVKSNIGHVDAAAGIAGLIKTVLALRHRAIPQSLHYQAANARIDFGRELFYVPTELHPHDAGLGPMRAGVSSFGIGGTNVHVVVEEPPAPSGQSPSRPFELLMLSARTPAALEAVTDRLADHLQRHPDLALGDVGHTLRQGRRGFDRRRFLVTATTAEAIGVLRGRDAQRLPSAVVPAERMAVAFMFPGLGDHYPAMGWEFYCAEPVFRHMVDECASLLRLHQDGDIRDLLFPGRDWSSLELGDAGGAVTDHAGRAAKLDLRAMLRHGCDTGGPASAIDLPAAGQPAIFVTEYALAQLLRGWSIEPDAMIGYSIGEFAAACLAGVFKLPDAIRVVAARANLIQARVKPGAMLAVPLGEAEVHAQLTAGVSIAAVSGARLTVVSGAAEDVADLERRLVSNGVSCQRLSNTYAYHSAMMEAIVDDLVAVVADSNPKPPRIPYVSCLTGTWISDSEATDPQYWARHLCRTVRFQDGLAQLMDNPNRILLEVGPGQSLSSHALAARAQLRSSGNPVIPTMRWSYGGQSELSVLLRSIGLLWEAGAPMDMTRLLAREELRRVPLPTYPFERQRHWIDPPAAGQDVTVSGAGARRPMDAWFHLPYWKPSVPQEAEDATDGTWLLFVDRYGIGAALAARLRRQGARVIIVTPGDGFRGHDDTFTLDPVDDKDYCALVQTLRRRDALPEAVVHLWSLTREDAAAPSSARFSETQELGFHSLMRLFRALCIEGQVYALRVEIVANGLFDVTGHEILVPEKATLLGPAMVAPQEHPGIACRCLDTDISADDPDCRDALVDQILTEIRASTTSPAIAYRCGRRWVQDYEPVRLGAPAVGRSRLRQRGVYLLTGGLGGVGLAMALCLARTVQARLVLVGRSSFPERADWPRWLAEHGAGDRTSIQIRRLQDLEALGAEVLTITANVADRAAMERALALTYERFGTLHGVFHGAGTVGVEAFCEITQVTTYDAEPQFAAKVHGLLVLDQVLAGRPLDFCVLMSSLAAILGGLGFAAYSAANLFLDAFARYKNRSGGMPWISIDWDSWRLSDLRPVIAGLGGTVSEFFMEPEKAAAACERILTLCNAPQVIVSTGDLQARLRQWVTRDWMGGDGGSPMTLHKRPELRKDYAPPRGQLEQTLAEIWRDLFRIDPIGIHDNFFELGGHSLLATQLNARISSRLRVEMSLAAVLQAPTIAELAQTIVSAQAARTDPETLERMLAQVRELSPQDLERMLAEDGDKHAMVDGHG